MKTMNVGEFAKQMEVSVRTLQYYDQIDLLKPSGYSEGGRRLYTAKDSFILYQIKALKQLGFRLDEIKQQLLKNTDIVAIKKILRNQKDMISQQIQNLTKAKDAIHRMECELNQMEDIDYDAYLEILQMMYVNPFGYWAMSSFDETLHEHVATRFENEPEIGMKIYKTWNELSDKILILIKHDMSPSSVEGQAIAKAWWDMVMEFTGGDMSLLQHLEKFNDDKKNWSEDLIKRQEKVDPFLNEALALYVPTYYEQQEEAS